MDRLRVQRALRHQVRTAVDVTFEVEDQIVVWSGQLVEDSISGWIGPFVSGAFNLDKRLVYVTNQKSSEPPKPLGVTQTKHLKRPRKRVRGALDESSTFSFSL